MAVDPKLGRIAVAREPEAMWVSYRYGFSDDVGAHESARAIAQPRDATVYRVGAGESLATIGEAIAKWEEDKPRHAVIEIADSGFYTEAFDVEIAASTRCRSAPPTAAGRSSTCSTTTRRAARR